MQVKKNPRADVGRNSSLFFSIGFGIMLFLTWQAFEFKTYSKPAVDIGILDLEDVVEVEIPITTMNVQPPPPPPPAGVVNEMLKIVDDVEDIEETIIQSTETSQSDRIAEPIVRINDVVVQEVEEEVEVPFALIEDVPTFPGCENLSKLQKRACFEERIQAHVVKNFQYPQVALDMGIHGRVYIMFTIERDGSISNLKTRGPDKILEDEAIRIIRKLPKLIPGKQREKPVPVSFSLPINFVLAAN